jgi:hypothetical protein
MHGVAQELINRLREAGAQDEDSVIAVLERMNHPRGEPNYRYVWARDLDGADIVGPLPTTQFAYTARKGWIAIDLVREFYNAEGAKWQRVDRLPEEPLRVAGEVA